MSLVGGLAALALNWLIGGALVSPSQRPVKLPATVGFPVENVEFPSASGATIKGWLVPAKDSRAVVIFMHGVYADRSTMLNRVRFLHDAGYSLLLFDFQAHGESLGKHITLGYLESRDATAAVDFVHQKFPGQKVAVIGVSMGGAAALLAEPPLPVQAMIVESAYPTIEQAIEDRIIVRLGRIGKDIAPLLTWQMKPRLGFGVDDLRPIQAAASVTVPKFFMAGDADRDTTVQESRDLFAAAAEPKQLWIVPGAHHEDLYQFAPIPYEKQVLEFLAKYLE
jgi:alpha-beta hydrolase superfamily lysophospholipase